MIFEVISLNIKTFSVATTNLFPATNTTNGGQLLTEFNLRARESVMSDESVKYMYGPSYVHAEDEFKVYAGGDSEYFPNSSEAGSTVLDISAGRAILNGYYVENLADMTIDLSIVAAEYASLGTPLSGDVCIGLRIMLSEETTMLGSIMGEDANGYYEGVQVVILPKDQFHVPTDKFPNPSNPQEIIDCGDFNYRNYVTADILLATVSYVNGTVSNVRNNPDKCQMFPASRIGGVDELLSDTYVKKTGLNPNKLYTFAGKGTDPSTGTDTWCDSTDSLMVWDNNPQFTILTPTENEATFKRSTVDTSLVQLIVPHKQIDGMVDGAGNPLYYKAKAINVPKADYATGAPGMVTKEYTDSVKAVNNRINEFYQLTNGKQVGFIPILNKNGQNDGETYTKLPNINDAWEAGDYILVAKDMDVLGELNDSNNISPPSTIYVVRPGKVTLVSAATDTKPDGMCLAVAEGKLDPETGEPVAGWSSYDWWGYGSGEYRGVFNEDYFQVYFTYPDGVVKNYYAKVFDTDGIKSYSDPVMLTGSIPFATTEMTGGFLNAPENYIDAGYVYLDDYGHLRLRDYALLRSGMLAYQLGQDVTIESGLTPSEIQAELDEYVNQRIAFPDLTQAVNSLVGTASTTMINVNMTLPDDTDGIVQFNITGIDSRFNTSVCLNIYGNSVGNTTINITDCAKIKVNVYASDSTKGNNPKIVIKRSCVYYDFNMFNNYLHSAEDITLWYTKLSTDSTKPEGKNLVVDGMTVRAVELQSMYNDPESNYNVVSSEYWSLSAQNDNHFDIALQSITFDGTATIIGCSVLVKNNSTSNITAGRSLFRDNAFVLPQGPDLYYPELCLRQAVNVTGRFISAYPTNSTSSGYTAYMMQETDFSLKSQVLLKDEISEAYTLIKGEVAFLVNAYELPYASATQIDVFDPNKFHHFSGTTLL